MNDFLEIKCLSAEEQKKITTEIEKILAQKKQDGILTDREIREIGEMKLQPQLDIQDVQGVYADHLFKPKK